MGVYKIYVTLHIALLHHSLIGIISYGNIRDYIMFHNGN